MTRLSMIAAAVAVLAAVSGGFYLLINDSSDSGMEIIFPTATPAAEVTAYVSGAVRSPGVFTVEEGDRVAGLVEAAGGVTEDADMSAVNLAARVKDEDHWHVPRIGEAPAPQPPGAQSDAIDINSADEELLKRLPGIGEVKARAIISFREANGPFSSADGLLEVNGIGAATLEAIRDLVEAR